MDEIKTYSPHAIGFGKADMAAPHEYQGGRIVPFSQRWYKIKIILRSTSLFFGLILFIAAVVGQSEHLFLQVNFQMLLAIGVLVDFYGCAELITFWIRRKARRGIHPGVTIGADFILMVIVIFALAVCVGNPSRVTTGSYFFSATYGGVPLEISSDVFLGLLLPIHIALCLRACYESKQRYDAWRPFKAPRPELFYQPGGGEPFTVARDLGPTLPKLVDFEHDGQSEVGGWGNSGRSIISEGVATRGTRSVMAGGGRAPSIATSMAPSGVFLPGGHVGGHPIAVPLPIYQHTQQHLQQQHLQQQFLQQQQYLQLQQQELYSNLHHGGAMSVGAAPSIAPSSVLGLPVGDGFSGYNGPADHIEHEQQQNYAQGQGGQDSKSIAGKSVSNRVPVGSGGSGSRRVGRAASRATSRGSRREGSRRRESDIYSATAPTSRPVSR
ncbi:hypothetical protein B0H63DRAFT_305844 [Podospora didyma]|uniref:Uncharacterized protein n=1 Tax=Podospora didyma TaxID=330526 RepID=A0AAE0K4P5_9PEZI|nr:hypothetical protein B0H63DRAFT_305844 [Podospora didyma]